MDGICDDIDDCVGAYDLVAFAMATTAPVRVVLMAAITKAR